MISTVLITILITGLANAYKYIALVNETYPLYEECFDFGSVILCVLEDESMLKSIYADYFIEVWQDGVMQLSACQRSAPWQLNSINDLQFPPKDTFAYDTPQSTQRVFVLDSWVDVNHQEFEGRVTRGPVFEPGSSHWHGTFVTGLALARNYGVNKNAKGVAVQVLNDYGNGAWSSILAGLNWVGGQRQKGIINISITGDVSRPINLAVNALIEKGWRIVVAAGNSNDDACKYSPASSNAIIVGSFNNKGVLSDFSNYGKCVSVLAPGEQVLSTYPGNSAAYASGTSFAAPLVAGIMSTNNWDKEQILQRAKAGINTNGRKETTNKAAMLGQKSRCQLEQIFLLQKNTIY